MTEMARGGGAMHGGEILGRISTEMVGALKQFYGKGPIKARSYFFDDLLIVVMRGGLTTAEKTMLEFDQEDQVREFRQAFENEMTGRLTHMIEDLTGRKVLTYQSQIMFDPDVLVEVFVFDDTPEDLVEATAEAQLEGRPVGEVEGERPSSSGQSQP